MSRLHRLSGALLALLPFLFWGCVGSMPHRTGYDRATGTWKRSHEPGGSTPATPPPGATPMTDTVAPSGKLPDGSPAIGQASWYGSESPNANTASGEAYVPADKTAAHRTLPFGTKLRVRYPKLKTQVEVRINDRGPHKEERLLDLSEGAAEALGLKANGTGEVWLDVLP